MGTRVLIAARAKRFHFDIFKQTKIVIIETGGAADEVARSYIPCRPPSGEIDFSLGNSYL